MASKLILCDLCLAQNKDISGVMWCPECDETLCTDCTSHHHLQKATKGHNLVDVNFKADLPLELTKQQHCTVHSQLPVEYYCRAHDFTCCRACLADEHRSCDDVITLDIACQNTKKSFFDEIDGDMKNIEKTLKDLQDESNKNASVLENESTMIEQKIAQAKAKAIKRINEYATHLLSELQIGKTAAKKYQNEIRQKCQNIANDLATHSNAVQFVKEHGTAKQSFLVAHNLKPIIEKMEESVSDIVKNAKVTTLKLDEADEFIPGISSLGRLTKSEQPTRVRYTPVKEKQAQCIEPRTDKPLTSFTFTSTFKTSNTAFILGMVVTVDNKLLLCNYTEKQEVLVYTENCQYIGSRIMKDWPYDITGIPGGGQYVVDLPWISSIQYINSKDLKPGRIVKLPTDNRTYGIAADRYHIYVGEVNKIFVLNHEGATVKLIKIKCSDISYLFINDNDLYASGNERIYCHSLDRNKTVHHTQISSVKMIRKIIRDRHGYLYIGGQESGKVHRFDKDLKENMIIDDDSVKEITSICFNKNCTKLFVASKSGKTIVVFSCT